MPFRTSWIVASYSAGATTFAGMVCVELVAGVDVGGRAEDGQLDDLTAVRMRQAVDPFLGLLQACRAPREFDPDEWKIDSPP